ncbi:MAG: DHH family phosphoesterase [Verrucomicrobiales bacterium]|nr:DHH family phosphoesterase [Verrucomicrobiales bacterium]
MNETPPQHSLSEIADRLRTAQRVAVLAHVRPDGDAVGSVMGLALSLMLAGKEVVPMLEDGVPDNLAFLPEVGRIQQPRPGDVVEVDVAVAVDTATKPRLGEGCNAALAAAPLWINIDHHPTNPNYGDLNHVNGSAPATGQLIYELLQVGGFPLNDAVRRHLYAAISTDTGSFQYPGVTARTLRIVAEMMEQGLETAELCRALYQAQPLRHVQLLGRMLREMRLTCEGQVASWQLTQQALREVAARPGDTEGLIDTLRMIDEVVVAVIFEELEDGKVRVSSRSKSDAVNVAEVCARFGGGGHRAAAGARLAGPLETAAENFLAELKHEVGRLA